jgi:hypothetical protein
MRRVGEMDAGGPPPAAGDEVVVAEDRVDVEVRAWAGGPDVLDRLLHALLPGDLGVGIVDPTRCVDLLGYRRVAGVPHNRSSVLPPRFRC